MHGEIDENTNRPKKIIKKSQDISQWYTEVIIQSELADYAPIKGCMVIRPYGYALWEKIQEYLDRLIKKRGVKNAYFPIFIPESFLKKEKEHVEGFSPELAIVTIGGGQKLKEHLVVRPTSETIMYALYKKWTRSWRDLPILINQWNNVVRWEKRTYLFLRTSEFLWQEGHCAHLEHKESLQTVLWALNCYKKLYNDLMAMYVITGTKSNTEKFAGAKKTFTIEILLPGGKALQGGTSHDLGQNFSKAFGWTIQDQNGKNVYPYQNSWGISTRSIGGLILAHGDDSGLILPPKIAPVQIVIVPIYKNDNKEKIIEYSNKVKDIIKKYRVEIDLREDETAGYKFSKWEIKGVPLRLEIGEKERLTKTVTLVRRDTYERTTESIIKLKNTVSKLLKNIQTELFERHKKFTEQNTHVVNNYSDFKDIMKNKKGFIKAFWCENPICEKKIKEETKATTRCLPINSTEERGKCVYCGSHAKNRWIFAQSY